MPALDVGDAVEVVGFADFHGGDLAVALGGELGEDFFPGVGLDVDADDAGGAGELGDFGGDEAWGERRRRC